MWCESGASSGVNTGVGGSVVAVTEVVSPWLGEGRVLWPEMGQLEQPIYFPDVREYLHSVEHDRRILGTYLQVLLARRTALQGSLRLVAIHHIP